MSRDIAVVDGSAMLLAGPRGRRFLLEYALASELARNPVRDEGTFGQAVVLAASRLAHREGGARAAVGDMGRGGTERLAAVTTAEVVERLNAVELLEPTETVLRAALSAAVDHASYWQKPDGEDILAASPEIRPALQRVSEYVAASPLVAWWATPVNARQQQSVQWDGTQPRPVLRDVGEALRVASTRYATGGVTGTRPKKSPTNHSGQWWSRPPQIAPVSGRSLFDGSPAGLWFVEDRLGWEHAESVGLIVPDGLRVLEIGSAADWAYLCTRFPLDVTFHAGDDWYRTTGRAGTWLMPNWSHVADHYDGVHLQVGAYLAAAGTAITIGGIPDTASVIAGWNPDETYWFTSAIDYEPHRIHWTFVDRGTERTWLPNTSSP